MRGVWVWVSVLGACAGDFSEVTDLDRPRVLAAVYEVVGRPGVSSPAPGERVGVEFVLGDPGARSARDGAFVVCIPRASDLDEGLCATRLGDPLAAATDPNDPASWPSIEFVVPDEATLGDADALLVRGAMCAGSLRAGLDLERGPRDAASPCASADDEGEWLTFRVPLDRGSPNHAPSFGSIRLDDAPLVSDAPPEAAETGCVGSDLPTLTADRTAHSLEFVAAAGSRESFTVEGTSSTETLVLAVHASDGDFDGSYAFFGDDDPRSLTFRAVDDRDPSPVPPEGRTLRFVFVLRDGRGGTAAATRSLCLVPAPRP